MYYFFSALKNYAVFSGRASRKEFWMFFLFYLIFLFAFSILDSVMGTIIIDTAKERHGLFTTIYWLATIIPYFAITVRRFHDIGKSGWWTLFPFVAFLFIIPIGLIPKSSDWISIMGLFSAIIILIYIFLLATKGDPLPNKYGPPPKTSN